MTVHAADAQQKQEEHRHASLTVRAISTAHGTKSTSNRTAKSGQKERKTTFTAHMSLEHQRGITSAEITADRKSEVQYDRAANYQVL